MTLDAIATAEKLTATVEQLSDADTVERVAEIVTASVRALLGADGTTFVLREDDQCHYIDEDSIAPLWRGRRFDITSCVSGWSMLHRQVAVIPDIYQDDRVPHDAYRPTFVTSLTMAPVRTADPLGAIGAYFAEPHVPDAAQIRLLEVIANSAAVALDNLELRGAIRRSGQQLDTAEARRSELEAAILTMVHDLRSPIGAMMGYAELLEEVVAADAPEAVGFASTIRESGQRMTEQIDRVLGLYRVTNRSISPEPVDLTAMAREVVAALPRDTGDRTVEFRIAEGLAALVDPVLVRTLLENLLGNAVKYSSHTERAVVELSRVEPGEPGDPGSPGDRSLAAFVVRDNGAGFDNDDADRLFRPLQRLHSDAEFSGTGLGLASVARIVAVHGGQVTARGQRGLGAEFTFSLPRVEQGREDALDASTVAAAAARAI